MIHGSRWKITQLITDRFLLADLHLRSLKTKSSRKAMRKALQSFSSGPDSTKEALDNAMQRVMSQPEEAASIALKALMILTTGSSPSGGGRVMPCPRHRSRGPRGGIR